MGQKCCAEINKPVKVEIVIAMRVIGAILILLSLSEFGVGATAFRYFTNYKLGSWWGAILPCITGILAAIAQPKTVTIAALVVSSLAVIIALAAAIVDGIASAVFTSEQTCITPTGTIYGYDSLQSVNQVTLCTLAFFPLSIYDCTCTGSVATAYSCYYYNGQTDCGAILTTYPKLLKASSALNAALCVICFTFCILACATVCGCCENKSDEVLISSSNPVAKQNENTIAHATDVKIVG